MQEHWLKDLPAIMRRMSLLLIVLINVLAFVIEHIQVRLTRGQTKYNNGQRFGLNV